MERQCRRLVQLVQQLSQCETLQDIVDHVRKAARELAGADGASFVLKEGDLCHYVDEDAISPMFKGRHFPAEICVSGTSMRTRETIVIPDIYADDRIPIEIYRPTFIKSMCMTPIRSAAPIGAIGVYWANHHACTEGEQQLLRALADSTSIAIENIGLQTQLRAKLLQIEKLSNLRDEFLRNVTHELMTPLHVMMGWSQVLSADEPDPEDVKEGLEAIEYNGHRQERIIKDLLDCSALMTGQMEMHPTFFALPDLIKPVLANLELAINAKRLEVTLADSDAAPLVFADYDRCKEVVWHALSNAVKFSSNGGTIRVDTGHDENWSRLEIIDSGIGIASEFLPKVFDLFSQEDTGIARAYQGTGLGLSICKYMMEAQGGQIQVESPGKRLGTRVVLKLPYSAIRFTPKKNNDPLYMANVFNQLLATS